MHIRGESEAKAPWVTQEESVSTTPTSSTGKLPGHGGRGEADQDGRNVGRMRVDGASRDEMSDRRPAAVVSTPADYSGLKCALRPARRMALGNTLGSLVSGWCTKCPQTPRSWNKARTFRESRNRDTHTVSDKLTTREAISAKRSLCMHTHGSRRLTDSRIHSRATTEQHRRACTVLTSSEKLLCLLKLTKTFFKFFALCTDCVWKGTISREGLFLSGNLTNRIFFRGVKCAQIMKTIIDITVF